MNDEAWLDEVFERLHSEATESGVIDLEALKAERPHLHEELDELFALVRGVAVGRAPAPRQLLGFEILSELGSGASGSVFLARRSRIGGRPVALKVLSLTASATDRGRLRFLSEVRALAAIDHPGVVRVLDIIEEGDLVAYAMEWIEGETLAARIEARRSGARTAPTVGEVPTMVRLGIELSRALAAVHAAGFLHRDVKPGNILIESGRDATTPGRAVLSDFGLVHGDDAHLMTREGSFLGTLAYAPPEQLRGEELGPAADVYSLGISLLEALNWTRPFSGKTTSELCASIGSGRRAAPHPRAPRLPRDLVAILAKATDIDSKRRYASAEAFAQDLERLANLEVVEARPLALPIRAARLLARNRARALSAAITAALLLAVFVPTFLHVAGRRDREARGQAAATRAALALVGPDLGFKSWMSARSKTSPDLAALDRPRLREAMDELKRALELLPEGPEREDRALELAVIRLLLGNALEPALPVTSKLVSTWREGSHEHAPDSSTERRALALASFLTGDLARAAELFDAPSPGTRALDSAVVGRAQLAGGHPAAALPHLEKASEAFAERAPGGIFVAAADACIATGDATRAHAYLTRAEGAELAPREHELRRVEADLAWLEGRLTEAFRGYEALLGRDYLAHQRLGQFREAEGWFERALSLYVSLAITYPDDPTHRRNLARCAERWWRTLGPAERRDALLKGLDEHVFDFGGLVPLMRGVLRSGELLRESATELPFPVLGHHDPAVEIGIAPPVLALKDFRLSPEARAFWDQLEAPGSLIDFARRIEADQLDPEALFRLSPTAKGELVDEWLAGKTELASRRDLLLETKAVQAPVASADPFQVITWITPNRLADEEPPAGFGGAAVGLDDLNGDGTPELAISAPIASLRGPSRGRVFIIDGACGELYGELSGGRALELFGSSLALVGDLDGDGTRELAISAPGFGFAAPGPVRVFNPRTMALVTQLTSKDAAGGDGFGTLLASLADITGDGVPDLAVSAPFRDGGSVLEGALEVFSGADLSHLATLVGQARMDYFGQKASSVADLDGDGVRDLAVTLARAQGGRKSCVQFFSTASWQRLEFELHDPRGQQGLGAALAAVDGSLWVTTFEGGALTHQTGMVRRFNPRSGSAESVLAGTAPRQGFGSQLIPLEGRRLAVTSFDGLRSRRAKLEIFGPTGERIGTLPGCTELVPLGEQRYLALFRGPERFELDVSPLEFGSAAIVQLGFD